MAIHRTSMAPGRRTFAERAGPGRRLDRLALPLDRAIGDAALRSVPVRAGRPAVADGRLVAGARSSRLFLFDDARAMVPAVARAYGRDPLPAVGRSLCPGETEAARLRHNAAAPFADLCCDALAELDALALLTGAGTLVELDAAVADAVDDWQTDPGTVVLPPPSLSRQLDAARGALEVAFAHVAAVDPGSDTFERLAAVTGDLVGALAGVVRRRVRPGWRVRRDGGGALVAAAGAIERVSAAVHDRRRDLGTAGHRLDQAARVRGDRYAVAFAVAARVQQVLVLAGSIAGWLAEADDTVATADERARWRAAAAAVSERFERTRRAVESVIPIAP